MLKRFFCYGVFLLFSAAPLLQAQTENEIDLESDPAAEAPKNSSIPLEEQLEVIERKSTKPIKKKVAAEAAPVETKTFAEEANKLDTLEAPPVTESPAKPPRLTGPWYRNNSEWVASRTIRDGLMGDEPTTKILTDGKRYDMSIGKRFPLISFGEESLTRGWSAGFDGGMLVTLFRADSRNTSNVTFASENFDGFFGGYLARALDDTILMYRIGHVSSHLVDNNPRVTRAIPYSRFWQEVIISQTLSSILDPSLWDIHVQGALGANFMSEPKMSNPRALIGIDVGRTLGEPGGVSLILSADARRPGVKNQIPNYSAFIGIGRLKRPETLGRPFKIGIAHHWGSDYRNQYYRQRTSFTAFEVQLEI